MKKGGKQRLVVVSLDAVGKRDMEYMLTLPNFKRFVEEGAFCDDVESVYPSLTYPAHTSIVTGKTPDHHRIVNNTRFQPDRKTPDWLYKEKYINGKTIVDIAKEKKLSVAAFLWPVMGGAKIDYNIPEVMCTRKHQNQVVSCLLNGTPKFLLEVNSKFGSIRKGIAQPELDNFIQECTKYTIEKYDPDVCLIHFTDVDTHRHKYGAEGEEIKNALKRHDARLGEIEEYLKKTRPMDETTFIVLGDHSQIDTHTIVYLNKALLDKGYLSVTDGKITDYKVIAKTNDASVYIYLNPKYSYDEQFYEELVAFFNELKATPELGIEEIYTSEEAAEMGADSYCFLLLEAKRGFYFLDETDVLTEAVEETKNHKMKAAHGCLPTKEENKTFFVAKGYRIKKGVKIEKMHLWDEGPTIAKILGSHLPGVDGKPVMEILE